MALRHALKLFRSAVPAMYSMSVLYAQSEENNKTINDSRVVKFDSKILERLSFDFMIKQSAVNAVNSASEAITIAYAAIESTSKEYRLLLSELMSLMEDTLIYKVSDEHEDRIIALRSEVGHKKKTLTQLIGYMDYVEKMSEAVAMLTNQSAELEHLAMSLCERMDDALKHKEREIRDIKKLEEEYYNLQERCVKDR